MSAVQMTKNEWRCLNASRKGEKERSFASNRNSGESCIGLMELFVMTPLGFFFCCAKARNESNYVEWPHTHTHSHTHTGARRQHHPPPLTPDEIQKRHLNVIRKRAREISIGASGWNGRAGGRGTKDFISWSHLYFPSPFLSPLPLIIYIFFYYSVIATVMVISTIVYCIVFHVLHILVGCARNFLFM